MKYLNQFFQNIEKKNKIIYRKSAMIEDAVEDLIGLAMQALNLADPDGENDQNGSNYGSNAGSPDNRYDFTII